MGPKSGIWLLVHFLGTILGLQKENTSSIKQIDRMAQSSTNIDIVNQPSMVTSIAS